MRRRIQSKEVVMGLGVALLLASCGGEAVWVPASGPTQSASSGSRGVWVRETSEASPQRAMVYPIELGSKVAMRVGRTLGYELVSQGLGSYRFRWTSDMLESHRGNRRFQGSVWTAGHFTSVVPGCADGSCPLEEEDHLSGVEHVAGGERIEWDTIVWDGWDGFSFTTDAEPLYFDLNVDGDARPDLLEFLAPGRPSSSGVAVGGLPAPAGG
jgi:hypothetical protein